MHDALMLPDSEGFSFTYRLELSFESGVGVVYSTVIVVVPVAVSFRPLVSFCQSVTHKCALVAVQVHLYKCSALVSFCLSVCINTYYVPGTGTMYVVERSR